MNPLLSKKLSQLPVQAGVYYHLDRQGQIIYVGKAANLKARVRQYFPAQTSANYKIHQLKDQIVDVKWTLTDNALQALFLEGEMIKRYQPKYNVIHRNVLSDQWTYVDFNLSAPNPNLQLSHHQDFKSKRVSLGPYLDRQALKRALKYLRRHFPYSIHKTLPKKACLDYHLGLCSGPETDNFDLLTAQANLKRLKVCLRGQQAQLIKRLQSEMKAKALVREYEAAAKLRNQIAALRNFKQSIIFTRRSTFDIRQDEALNDLRELFKLRRSLNRIEAYDISHISGQYTTAAMVVARNGVLDNSLGRRFKSRLTGNDDVGQIEAVLSRRFKSSSLNTHPDLILIDGGRGQVSAVLKVLRRFNLSIPVIGLAKKQEQIVFKTQSLTLNSNKLEQLKGQQTQSLNFTNLSLPLRTPLIKFLQRLRDASHRSAWRYHNYLQTKAQTSSQILDLPTIGPATYKKLMNHFHSLDRLATASSKELAQFCNPRQTKILTTFLKNKSARHL